MVIPDGVTKIGNTVFCDYKGGFFTNGWMSIDKRTYKDSLTSIMISSNVTEIGVGAFYACTELTDITIPDGMTNIGDHAFYGCSRLTSITIPDSVTSIGNYAFSGCSSLTNVTIPDGVTNIGDCAFNGCRSLADSEGFVIVRDVLYGYYGAGGDIVIPDKVREIEDGVFLKNGKLKAVTIPESVTKICYDSSRVSYGDGSAFCWCNNLKKLTIPAVLFRKSYFQGCPLEEIHFTPKNWMQTEKLPKLLTEYTLSLVAEDAAWLLLHQTAAEWQVCVSAAIATEKLSVSNVIQALIAVINNRETPLKAAELNRVYAFASEHRTELSAQDVTELKEACLNNSPKAAKKLDWDTLCASETMDAEDELEKYALSNNQHPEFFTKALKVASDKIRRTDKEGYASKNVIAVLLAEYAYLYEQASSEPEYMLGRNIYHPEKLSVSELAEKIAEELDRKALSAYLKELASGSNYRPWLLSFARFATEDDMRSYCSGLSKHPAREGYRRDNAMTAMCLSDTRSAMLYLDKAGNLDRYAAFHGTDADTLRDTVLSDLGLDEDGKISYDLGGTTVTATLQADLTLSLFDTVQNKTVKSMPKKGNDEALVAAAAANLSELKKNIKKVAKNRCDNLFADFLDGKSQKAENWRKAYLTNPLLRQIANLLVWEQDGKTFTLSGKDAISADETAYAITDSPIKLAHPMEMQAEEVKAWQKYFNANGLKQPFAQIWEPVCDLNSIDKNRYNGLHIPAYRFSKQEKHGIMFDIDFGMNDVDFGIADCKLECSFENVVMFHTMVDLKADAVLGKFKIKKPSRQANHIVSLLDKWTVYGRIIKDDVTVLEQLGSANVAQLMEYIRVANENNAVNVTAALLEYKNEHFADFDPVDEFVL